MKCEGCGKEIPIQEQEYEEIGGESIPRPCKDCQERLKKESKEYNEKYESPARRQKKKGKN